MKKVFLVCAALLAVAATTGCKNQQTYELLPPLCGCDFYTGNILFVLDTNSLKGYCHVAITECDDTTLYVYETNTESKVVKRPFEEWAIEWYLKFVTTYGFPGYVHFYAMEEPYDTTALLKRLSQLTNSVPDSINDESLLRQCFFYTDGTPVFDARYTSLTQMADTSKMFHFRIE